MARVRAGGRRARAGPRWGAPRVIGADDERRLRAQVEAFPGATLAEHCARWEASRGRPISRATMQRALARIGVRLPGPGGGRRATRGHA